MGIKWELMQVKCFCGMCRKHLNLIAVKGWGGGSAAERLPRMCVRLWFPSCDYCFYCTFIGPVIFYMPPKIPFFQVSGWFAGIPVSSMGQFPSWVHSRCYPAQYQAWETRKSPTWYFGFLKLAGSGSCFSILPAYMNVRDGTGFACKPQLCCVPTDLTTSLFDLLTYVALGWQPEEQQNRFRAAASYQENGQLGEVKA